MPGESPPLVSIPIVLILKLLPGLPQGFLPYCPPPHLTTKLVAKSADTIYIKG
jgi:hypothetical protein